MAKPLPNEEQLYCQIREERISVHPFVWDVMYHYLGDYISAINLIVSFALEKNEPVTLDDARRILDYTRLIKDAVDKVLHPEKISNDGALLEKIRRGDCQLHPVIKEFFTHYVGNDTHMINLCVSFYLDPIDEQPIPLEDAQKILSYTLSMRDFLNKLREATSGVRHDQDSGR